MFVFESLASGFVPTPFQLYLDDISRGSHEIKIVRIAGGLSARQKLQANTWLNEHAGTPYDYRAYIVLIWHIALRLPHIWNSQRKARFYCTEAVQSLYQDIENKDIFDEHLIAPIHIEKAVAVGMFRIVAETIQSQGA